MNFLIKSKFIPQINSHRKVCSQTHLYDSLGIFRVALLFICQGSVSNFILNFFVYFCFSRSFCLLSFSAATLISYHDHFVLSTTFLNLFLTFFKVVCRFLAVASATKLSISFHIQLVNTKNAIFLNFSNI